MQPILEIKAFFFNAKTDYLPYYKQFTIELNNEMKSRDILTFIKEKNENFTYPSEKLFFKMNDLVLNGEELMSDVVAKLGTELKIDPLNTFRSNNGLVINDDDFMQTYELLAPYATEEDLAYYETLYGVHYASETEKFEHSYIGDAILLLAHKMIANGSEYKEEILYAITYPHSSLLDCEYENNFFHEQDHTKAIDELKEMVTHTSDETSFMEKLTARFTKNEDSEEESFTFENKNIGYYACGVNEKVEYMHEQITQADATVVTFTRSNKLSGFSLLQDNRELAYKKIATTLLDALDSGVEILIIEENEVYEMCKKHFKDIEVTIGREIDMQLISAETFLVEAVTVEA